MKNLLKNQESWLINGGNTTKHFKLEKGTKQGDPTSVIVFLANKENKKIKTLNIFNHDFYTQHMLMTFFLKDNKSLIEDMTYFHLSLA